MSHSSEIAPKPVRVLLVDDTLAQRYVLVRTLERAGFEVVQAASGAEALRIACDVADIIVLDVQLPDVDGFAVARRLRADPRTAHLPVIHISAVFVSDADREAGLASGADAYLVHPVDPSLLSARIRELVSTRPG